MQSTSPYKPYRTDQRNPALTDDYLTRHKNTLFEPFKSESPEKRADALRQIGPSLMTWAQLAYPGGPDSILHSSIDEDFRPNLQRDHSGEGVFNIDDEGVWTDTDLKYNVDRKSHNTVQTPPWSAKTPIRRGSTPEQEGYSYYGEETIFSESRSTSELKEILKSYLLTILRASVDCPFADVRRYCRFILNRVQTTGASVPGLVCDGPSWLIPAVETIAFAHDAATEKSCSSIRQIDSQRSGSWISSSFSSETSELSIPASGSLKRIRSGIMTPLASPSKSSLSRYSIDTEHDDKHHDDEEDDEDDEVVFEADQESETSSTANQPSPNASIHASPKAASATISAIPISRASNGSRKSAIVSNDIDDILLGPLESRTQNRKARFSIDPATSTILHDTVSSQNRPSLGRKRTNSTTYTIHQRRASRSLRSFHLSCYMSTGRISNFGKILSYFPRFYETEIILHDELIRKEGGPLPRGLKLYLSILAAAQAKCQYLVSYFSKKFVQLGTNIEWLEGLEKAPRKVQRLGKVIAILAKQPWTMQKEHIEELLGRSKESIDKGDSSDQWTMGELVQTFCILIVINCQAHFCLATGIVPEADTFGGACIKRDNKMSRQSQQNNSVDVFPLFTSYDSRAFASPASHSNSYKLRGTINEDSQCMIVPTKDLLTEKQSPSPLDSDDEETIPSLLWKRRQSFNQSKLWTPKTATGTLENNEFNAKSVFAQCAIMDESDFILPQASHTSILWAGANLIRRSPGANGLLSPAAAEMDVSTDTEANLMPINPILEDMSRFYDSQNQLDTIDFDLQDTERYPVLRLADCNWEDHTCSLIGRFVPNLETVLDQNLQEARVAAGDDDEGFFFNSADGSSIDQGPLRDAVWFFILRLYGIYHDGYAYTDVNLLLNTSAKKYLKKVCMRPEQINRSDWKSIGKGLKSQERVLLALLASHARMYACLVYAFRFCQ